MSDSQSGLCLAIISVLHRYSKYFARSFAKRFEVLRSSSPRSRPDLRPLQAARSSRHSPPARSFLPFQICRDKASRARSNFNSHAHRLQAHRDRSTPPSTPSHSSPLYKPESGVNFVRLEIARRESRGDSSTPQIPRRESTARPALERLRRSRAPRKRRPPAEFPARDTESLPRRNADSARDSPTAVPYRSNHIRRCQFCMRMTCRSQPILFSALNICAISPSVIAMRTGIGK